MRWPRRGILIRLAIYVPLISLLAWRAQGGCDEPGRTKKDDERDELEQKLAPHRKVITLPDGTQQEIVELTAEEAEAILGHPIPRNFDELDEKPAEAKAGGSSDAKAAVASDAKAAASSDAKATASDAKTTAEAKTTAVKASPDARPADAPPAP